MNDTAEIQPQDSIFTAGHQRNPIPMYLHDSLGKGGKLAIAKKIRAAGGDPTADEEHAEVVICREDHPAFSALQVKYDHYRYVWVEPPWWVDVCLRRRRYKHVSPGPVTPRTSRPRARAEFSREDDRYLAEYLALRLPFKESGLRTGNGVYKELVAPEREQSYPWANRHSWMSWRERYKKNQPTFDSEIERIVARDPDPPVLGGKGQYFIRTKKPVCIVESDDDYSLHFDPSSEAEGSQLAPRKRKFSQLDSHTRRVSTPHSGGNLPLFQESEGEIDGDIDSAGKKAQLFLEEAEEEEIYNDNAKSMGEGPENFNFRELPIDEHESSARLHFLPIAEFPNVERGESWRSNGSDPFVSHVTRRTPEGSGGAKMPLVEEPNVTHAVPPDTQATLVQSSSRPTRSSAEEDSQARVYPNTRSHAHQPRVSQPASSPPPRRARGKRKVPPDGLRSLAPIGESDVIAAGPDVPQAMEERADSDIESVEKELLDGQKKMLSTASNTRSKTPPHVDLNMRASSSQKTRSLRHGPSYAHHNAQTPTRGRGVGVENVMGAASRHRSLSGSSSDDSFPAEPTNAWEYKSAKAPFEPGPGTRANEFLRSTRLQARKRAS